MSQTVSRAITVMRFIAEKPRSLSEVAVLLDSHKSTALRTLQTLVAEDFARQDDTGRYRLGFGLIALADATLGDLEIRQFARPHLEKLVEQLGHTVHLAQRDHDRILYIDKLEGRGTVAMGSRVGHEVQLHTAGVSKAILAHVDEQDLQPFINRMTFERFTDHTITSASSYEQELATTRERGWAEDDGENEDYINCVALPIYDARGRVSAAFSVTALRAVAPLPELREVVPLLQDTATAVSHDLGWRSP